MVHTTTDLRPVLARPGLREYLEEIWQRRDFLTTVPRNKLRAAKLDTFLGSLWYLVNPALMSLVYILVFGLLLDTRRGVPHFPTFLVIGVLTFNLLTTSALNATRVMYQELYLIRAIYFPRAIVPLMSALTNLYMFGPALGVMFVMVIATGEPPTWRLLLLPFVVAILITMTLGAVFVSARAGYEIPDLHSLLPHVLRLLLYFSGILFDPAQFTNNKTVLLLFKLNPSYEIIALMRWSMMGRHVDGWMWLSASTWAVVGLVGGFIWFWRAEINYGGAK